MLVFILFKLFFLFSCINFFQLKQIVLFSNLKILFFNLEMDLTYTVLATAFFSAILLSSLVLNTIACYIIALKVKTKRITHLFIFSMSVGNILEAMLGFIPQMVMVFHKNFLGKTTVCIASGFVVFGFVITNIAHITGLAVIRAIAMKYPIFYYTNCKKIWCRVASLSLCYLYGIVWGSFPLLGWSKYDLDLDGKRCSLDWGLSKSDSLSFIKSVLIFCYVIPGAIIIVAMFTSTRAVSLRQERDLQRSNQNSSMDSLEKEYLKAVLVSATMFFIILTPYAVAGILALCKVLPPKFLITVSAMFIKMNAISNVIANCFINKSFRNQFLDIAIFKYFKRSSQVADEVVAA